MNYYEQLGIAPDCDFSALKKAYYKRAKECHPDLFGNAPEKAEEFKRLVMIFDTLSDPVRRRMYDETVLVESRIPAAVVLGGSSSIMDTDADDTLEELIVGNAPPEDTRLTTLFRDLEKTFVFMTCREAKNLYAVHKYRSASKLFENLVSMAPTNILYRVWLARVSVHLHDYGKAKRHYRAALILGERRVPQQKLSLVRRELEELSRKRSPLLHKIRRFLSPSEELFIKPPEEEMIEETSRIFSKLLAEERRKDRKRLK